MKNSSGILISLVLSMFCFSLAEAESGLLQQSQALFQAVPAVAPAVEGSPALNEKIALGHMLYFDPRLSASHLISCQTCHNVGLAGADLQETSVGHGWQKGPRNAPTVFNAVFNRAQFWDGRAKDLAEQAKGPVQASVEMNNTPEKVVEMLNSLPAYVTLFAKAFPGENQPVTFDNMAKAIESFEATLLTPNAPFDRYLGGDQAALTATQKKGLELYITKGCAACHSGINIGGDGYYPFGLAEKPHSDILPPEDTGRFMVTQTPSDQYSFRSPSLRNVALTMPYFHSGKVWKLLDAVKVMGSAQLGLILNESEAKQITDFLTTLTGDQPRVEHPVLPATSETTPRPVQTAGAASGH